MKFFRQTPNTYKQKSSKPEGVFEQTEKVIENVKKQDYLRWFKMFLFVDALLLWLIFSTVFVFRLALNI